MSEHDWFRDNLDLHVAGALAPDENLRAERHAAACAECAQELAQRRLLEGELGRLCAAAHFSSDWDERVQARWRTTLRPPRSVPATVRWALAAAAVLLIGAVGAGVNAMAQQGMIGFPGGDALQAKGLQLGMDVVGDIELLAHANASTSELDANDSRRAQVRNNLTELNVDLHDVNGRGEAAALRGHSLAKTTYGRPDMTRHHFDGARTVNGTHGLGTGGMGWYYAPNVPGSVNPDEAAGIRDGDTKQHPMNLEQALRLRGQQLRSGNMITGLVPGSQWDDDASRKARTWGIAVPADPAARDIKDLKALDMDGSLTAGSGRDVNAPAAPPTAYAPPAAKPESGARVVDGEQASLAKLNQLRAGAEYFKLRAWTAGGGQVLAGGIVLEDQVQKLGVINGEERRTGKQAAPQAETKKEPASADAGLAQPAAVAAGQAQPVPQVAQRKIIRTGDMEFEVSVFDDTVAQITKLIGAIPGAFVATVNSEKLPNGKVKGSVVVRVPPEALDKFVLDLRQTLAKTGELKSQKIGSADVTKQYTDIESRLRAAHTMEERLLAIIKTGKGEVKDLVAAERELGVWRTKIEEMEGEIRYYNSQVALSTLTITVYEKEIRAAAEMVITEHVTMKIEADDVEKSLQAALLAVTEAKGRVTKSDLKQHAGGQLEAMLTFEVAPAQAGAVKDKLKGLGVVTHHDAQRLQQAEGGAAPQGEFKSRTNDVRFSVTLYNVANIQPREAFVLQVVVTDVPAEYRKLLDGVAAAKGQVRVSQLDEKDKANTFAQLDFDVPTGQRDLFDKILTGLGEVVTRNTTRAGPGESATDRKVGYRLTLKSETSVPPRETFTLAVYSLDVPAAYRKLQATAAQLKGHIRSLQLNEQEKNNVTAQFDVDVLRSDMAALERLLDETGEVAARSTTRLQPGEIASDRKVGYRLTLRSQVPPRETLDLNIEVPDVDSSAAALAALVKSAQGRVTAWEGTQDASGKAVAILLFDVPLTAKDALASQFKAIGKVRGQKAAQNLQAPDGKLATVHINVRLTNMTPIVPSDEGLWPQVRRSLGYAFSLLSVSLMFLIVGLCVLLPWALIGWLGFKLVRRLRNKDQTPASV